MALGAAGWTEAWRARSMTQVESLRVCNGCEYCASQTLLSSNHFASSYHGSSLEGNVVHETNFQAALELIEKWKIEGRQRYRARAM